MQFILINHIENILPAGITLYANYIFPMRERISCFVHLCQNLKNNREDNRSCLQSSNMVAYIFAVLVMIPKNKRQVDGPSILDDFTGILICLQKESMVIRLLKHSFESGDPAIKSSSR